VCSRGAGCERRHIHSLLRAGRVKTTQAIGRWHGNLNQHYVVKTTLLMKSAKNTVGATCDFETWDVSQQTDVSRLITCDTENTATFAGLEVV